MSNFTTRVLPLLLCLPFFLAAPAAVAEEHVPASEVAAQRDLVSTAVADGRFEVLAAALNAADLIETLRGEGPFTVFAPTDAAFAALPEGAVANLLRPENQAALQRVLTAHVVAGRVPSSALLSTTTVKTVSGASFDLGLRVGNANVTQADVGCTNGIIHVIDAVLLPPMETAPTIDAKAVIGAALEIGVPMFNAGDEVGCAAVYHAAAKRLAHAGRTALSDLALWDMKQTLAHAPADASKRAWALRGAFDRTLDQMEFKPTMEASLPAGFPAPGPLGQVVEKSYPKYRAARAAGGGQTSSFWVLFQHIKKNNVEMTAPVEMTMDGDMQMEDMAFLYESPEQGAAGTQGSVKVLDIARVNVLSIGMRGRRTAEDVKTAKVLIEMRRSELGLRVAGSWRVLGYNGPMVAASQQYWELQVPVAQD